MCLQWTTTNLDRHIWFSMKLTQVIRCSSSLHPIDLHLERSLWLRRRLRTCQHEILSDHQNSPYSAPIVLVTKKDGSNRLCTDFRRLNEVTKKDAFPLPQIDQILDHLHGATIFSSLDLASGLCQVPLAESAMPKTAFVTPDGGHYEYLRLPFGLCNAPGTFQQLMTSIINEYLFSFVLIFLDDVLVFSRNVEEHEKHMRIVFHALRQANLKLKPKNAASFKNP